MHQGCACFIDIRSKFLNALVFIFLLFLTAVVNKRTSMLLRYYLFINRSNNHCTNTISVFYFCGTCQVPQIHHSHQFNICMESVLSVFREIAHDTCLYSDAVTRLVNALLHRYCITAKRYEICGIAFQIRLICCKKNFSHQIHK